MTDRAEIERLLNQTSRTLEGLPTQDDYWYSDDYVDRNEEIGMMMYRSGFKRNEPYIMHQSDVIELLVGALRDALDKPKNRPLTKHEIAESIQVIPCVLEEKKFGLTYADILQCSAYDNKYYGMYKALTSAAGQTKYDIANYGKTWRCWASRPTDEERSAAAWETCATAERRRRLSMPLSG